MTDLWAKLKQRKLVQWVLAYVAFAFALLQAVDIVATRFAWPGLVEKLLILALCIGFVVTLILAWYHGEQGRQRVSGIELIILAVVLAVGGGFLWQFTRTPQAPAGSAAKSFARPAPAQARPATGGYIAHASTVAIPAKSIAVLPFENLSSDKDNGYFADGMQDLILTKLADIGGLKVISRTSTLKYASHPDDLKAVGRQLGVATVLEGSVQKAGNQVLVNVQLIDTRSDSHLWAESYQRTLANVFGVEGEVAGRIAKALKAKLSPTEAAALAHLPTQNPAAYNAFLKAQYHGRAIWTRSSGYADLFKRADREFAEAVRLDPSFALAYARWGYVQTNHYVFLTARYMAGKVDPDLLTQARAHIDTALRLAPDLPEAHASLGWWFIRKSHDNARASAQFRRALALDPKQDEALKGLAGIAGNEGRLDEALHMYRSLAERDPRDVLLLRSLSRVYRMLGDYKQSTQVLQRAVAIDPTDAIDKLFLADAIRRGSGDLSRARRIIEALRATPGQRWNGFIVSALLYIQLCQRDGRGASQLAREAPEGTFRQPWVRPYYLGMSATIQHQDDQARRDFEQARGALQSYLTRHPDSDRAQYNLGLVLAYLGQADAALAAGQRVMALSSKGAGVLGTADARYQLAQIHAVLGQAGPAVAILEDMRARHAIHGSFTPWDLRLDPSWDPIRHDPRFEAFLGRFARSSSTSTTSSTE